jgi:hypothetical protein
MCVCVCVCVCVHIQFDSVNRFFSRHDTWAKPMEDNPQPNFSSLRSIPTSLLMHELDLP